MTAKYVYVMLSENGPIKVGIAADPKARLASIQSASPWKITLVHASEHKDAGIIERAVHLALRDRRLTGEWFSATADEAIEAIKRVTGEIPDIVDDGPSEAIGYILVVPSISETAQRASIRNAVGRDIEIFVDSISTYPTGFRSLLKRLRRNEQNSVVVHRLYTMARNRRDLRVFLGDFAKRKATVVEADTGRKLTHSECANVILDALDWIGSRGKTFADPKVAAEAGELGKRTQVRVRKKMYVPKAIAWPIWSDKTLSTEEALRRINAIPGYGRKMRPLTTAYNHYGKREVFAGRRPSKKD